jgi:hypothetical protein
MRDALDRDQRLCRNFLAILRSLDRHELVAAGVLGADDLIGWVRFRDDHYRAYLGLGSEREAKCFALVQTRLVPELRAAAMEATS